ncbi:hypothetical protein Kpol_1041p14 [Vanderwaltozyma polyspora DSM 70294]|uniref:MARVEL domain-containing protein n=1 Tax=Vanderwaltozyma polyspora (strain ATCC 22028 / DSM 70294 / BCRC 21397 / CBS 2163 / NBRC 10782 / NRRL Y-8283 / UCD 57-17) TaxID=436907 RepID=A7TL81_VANPO|nr:uncharacterized protein Kpol_1041p14 [Vanderwaltozyma polyspora DSM 70294]EDO16956.1 hypothetical protein Kpol_1041p14 [Vanderwaltozyma polyspora DSM 70294]
MAMSKSILPFSIIRFFQFASATLVMSLIAFATRDFHHHSNPKINLGLSVGVISEFYMLCVMIGTLLFPSLVFAGLLFISEAIVMCLYISGFITVAYQVGKHHCRDRVTDTYNPKYGSLADFNEYGGRYNEFTNKYTDKSFGRACNSLKAATAFAGLNTVLFMVTCTLVGINVMRPITNKYGMSGLFKTGSSMGTKLQRFTGLTLSEPVGDSYGYSGSGMQDAEQGNAYSTADSSNNNYQEKPAGTEGNTTA